jgi:DNA-binding Lrp family transcriptional regulator
MMKNTSLEAFMSIRVDIGKRQLEVYKIIKKFQPINNREIAKRSCLPINSVTPRVKELRDKGIIRKHGIAIDTKTNRKAICWSCV